MRGLKNKVIITCAVTGGAHTPTMSPFLPYKPEDIAAQSVEAAEAGASILHLHARDPDNGKPRQDAETYLKFLPRIKQQTDAILNITTTGALGLTFDQRLAGPIALQPEMCSLNMGSINIGAFPIADKYEDWKFSWEEEYHRATEDLVFRNTFKEIRLIIERLGKTHGTRFEHECYDVSHLYNLAWFVDQKIIEPPFFIQTIFGIMGSIGAEFDNVLFMKRTADRLFGDDYVWSVLAAGRHQMSVGTNAAMMGGNVRVGLEDNLYIGRGKLASSNAEQVRKMRQILEALDLEVATPAEVRDLLNLKGADRVGF